MPIDISKINPRGKLKNLIAKDLFEDNCSQIFDAQTGKLIGMLRNGKEVLFNATSENETKPEQQPDPKQLNLF